MTGGRAGIVCISVVLYVEVQSWSSSSLVLAMADHQPLLCVVGGYSTVTSTEQSIPSSRSLLFDRTRHGAWTFRQPTRCIRPSSGLYTPSSDITAGIGPTKSFRDAVNSADTLRIRCFSTPWATPPSSSFFHILGLP